MSKKPGIDQFFTESETDKRKIKCTICKKEYSTGSDSKKSQSGSVKKRHLQTQHSKEFEEFEEQTKSKKRKEESNVENTPNLFNLRTKKERSLMIQTTVDESFDRVRKYDFYSDEAQKKHRRVLETMILDLRPFSDVNKPGFIRLCYEFDKRFDLATDNYYRNQLDPTYKKIKSKVKAVIEEDKPMTFALTTDIWSSFHHSYLGINLHYLKNFRRVKFNVSCHCFDVRHTGVNIKDSFNEKIQEWGFENKISMVLRDNASNMKSAFENYLPSVGCLSHTLQLVIKDKIFKMDSIENLIKKCRTLNTYASMSILFYTELYHQEKIQMDLTTEIRLQQDVPTRWNSSYIMMNKMVYLKQALIPTIAKFPDIKVEFSNKEWELMEKVVKSLEPFAEATLKLSKDDACISQVIPFIATIMVKLQVNKSNDHGVIMHKRELIEGMNERFSLIEHEEEYAYATILDPRYKCHVFRDATAAQVAKDGLKLKLEKLLRDERLSEEPPTTSTNNNAPHDLSFDEAMAKIINKSQSKVDVPSNTIKREVDDFFEFYINSPVEKDDNPFGYWQHLSESSRPVHQKLAQLASIYLTPPATTVDVERLFSTTGDILTNERNRMNPETVDKILFCRANMGNLNFKY